MRIITHDFWRWDLTSGQIDPKYKFVFVTIA